MRLPPNKLNKINLISNDIPLSAEKKNFLIEQIIRRLTKLEPIFLEIMENSGLCTFYPGDTERKIDISLKKKLGNPFMAGSASRSLFTYLFSLKASDISIKLGYEPTGSSTANCQDIMTHELAHTLSLFCNENNKMRPLLSDGLAEHFMCPESECPSDRIAGLEDLRYLSLFDLFSAMGDSVLIRYEYVFWLFRCLIEKIPKKEFYQVVYRSKWDNNRAATDLHEASFRSWVHQYFDYCRHRKKSA